MPVCPHCKKHSTIGSQFETGRVMVNTDYWIVIVCRNCDVAVQFIRPA